MTYTERQLACGNMITFSANRLQYASNKTKLEVSTQLFDRGLLNRNGVMDIWNMPQVEDGDKYYIRKEYTEVSELDKHNEQTPQVLVVGQQPTQEPAQQPEPTPPDDEPKDDDAAGDGEKDKPKDTEGVE